ncbi:MAG TPA: hypothetical protein VLK58_09945 [Conexibacter sp.]|nr:hypothetical protein [Conexibacter sp.]
MLVILDGASEPVGAGPTSLERAAPTSLERAVTPALDALCAAGALTRLRTVAPWLEAGSEHAIPALLGWIPPAPVDRGAVEAAARAIDVPAGCRAWRVDVREARGGGRADAGAVRAAVGEGLPRFTVHALGRHRLLIVGPAPLPSLPSFAGLTLHVWPEGVVPPRLFGAGTVVIAAPGAAAGIARLMGAHVVTPSGATGRPGSDLPAKARAALGALAAGATRVVVHVGAPDEAAHELDAAAKVTAIEAADRDLIAPLAEAVRAAGGTLRVCPDHGCDPADGRHDAAPVPCLTWSAPRAAPRSAQDAPRLTERAVAGLPVVELAQRERVAA